MLVLAAPGTISGNLIHAVEREFPWVVVEQRGDVSAAEGAFDHPVSLILVDVALIGQLEAAASDLMRLHPRAIVALIEPGIHEPARLFAELSALPMIRGVLPMNVSLDVWLSVVRLMLCGGEYFPPHLLRSQAGTGGHSRSPAAGLNGASSPGAEHMDGLTPREVQILEMVSRGLQNKSIAAAFSLSESTVKIHLHNIIAKLGVHNRTEAAARFRDRAPQPSP
jgi:DNA-binding NarL/FixJ family response regulator